MTDREFGVLLIGGLLGVVVITASIAWLVYEIRRVPLIEDETRARVTYEEGRAAMNAAADDLGIDAAHALTTRVDEIDGWVALWAEQQRKEGR